MTLEQQQLAAMRYNEGLQFFSSAWNQHYLGNLAAAWALYEQASARLYDCIQILQQYSSDNIHYMIARCRVNLAWLAWTTGQYDWHPFLEQALLYLQQASSINPGNATYKLGIDQIHHSLGTSIPPHPRVPTNNDRIDLTPQIEAQLRALETATEELRKERLRAVSARQDAKIEARLEESRKQSDKIRENREKDYIRSIHGHCNNIACKICAGW